jgi:hypothetical protein
MYLILRLSQSGYTRCDEPDHQYPKSNQKYPSKCSWRTPSPTACSIILKQEGNTNAIKQVDRKIGYYKNYPHWRIQISRPYLGGQQKHDIDGDDGTKGFKSARFEHFPGFVVGVFGLLDVLRSVYKFFRVKIDPISMLSLLFNIFMDQCFQIRRVSVLQYGQMIWLADIGNDNKEPHLRQGTGSLPTSIVKPQFSQTTCLAPGTVSISDPHIPHL